MSCSDSEDDLFFRAPRNPINTRNLRMRDCGRHSVSQSVSSLAPAHRDPDSRHQLRPRRRRMSHSDSPTPLARYSRRLSDESDAHARGSATDPALFVDENDSPIRQPNNLYAGSQTTKGLKTRSLLNTSATSAPSLFLKRGESASNLADEFACLDIGSMSRPVDAVLRTSRAQPFFRGQFASTWSATSASFKRFPGSIPLRIPEEVVFDAPKATRFAHPNVSRRPSHASVASIDWELSKPEPRGSDGAPSLETFSTKRSEIGSIEDKGGSSLQNNAAPPKLRKRPSSSRIPRLASLQQLRPTPAVIESAVALALGGNVASGDVNVALGSVFPTASSSYPAQRVRHISFPTAVSQGLGLSTADENTGHLVVASGNRLSQVLAPLQHRVPLGMISTDDSDSASLIVRRSGKNPRLSASTSSLPNSLRFNMQPRAAVVNTDVPHVEDIDFEMSDAES